MPAQCFATSVSSGRLVYILQENQYLTVSMLFDQSWVCSKLTLAMMKATHSVHQTGSWDL